MIGRFGTAFRRRSTAPRLLVSGLGDDTGGGIYVRDGAKLTMVDSGSTTGVAVSVDRRRFARLYWSEKDSEEVGELRVYDETGVCAHRCIESLRQPHSVLWSNDTLVAVSTGTNEILWIGASGCVERRWRAPGNGDCWHLNSLTLRRGRLLVSAFGRFSERYAWADAAARHRTGIVVDVRARRDVLAGLSAPHNPVWTGEGWLICNSGEGQLLRLDPDGNTRAELRFDGWTRGLACDRSFIYVGVSAHRLRGEQAGTAYVAVVRRDRFEEVERWGIDSREIYDVAFVPEPLVAGIRADCAVAA